MKRFKAFFPTAVIILLGVLFYYLPILLKPELFLGRNNDLTEFFWPIIYFVKKHLLSDNTLPFWNNLFLSGTPLLPDPQSPIFYPLNLIFLILPIDKGFIASSILHTFVGGCGAYLLARKGLTFSKTASLLTALFYIASPKLSGFLVAGHVGLINSMAWVPFTLLGVILVSRKPKIVNSLLIVVPLALTFYSHTAIFILSSLFSAFLFLLLLKKENIIPKMIFFGISIILTFGLIAITFLLQLEWQEETTRYLLLTVKDTYPKWSSGKEFINATIFPIFKGKQFIQSLDSEKWIAIGFLPMILSLIGFIKLKRSLKFVFIFSSLLVFMICLNNASPIYSFLLNQKWFDLLRVSTRLWPIVVISLSMLSGFGLEALIKTGKKKLAVIFGVAVILESSILSWIYITQKIKESSLAPKEVYEFLSQDKDHFRVYCLTRCLSQKESVIYNLELVDGYSTLIQKNYNSHAFQLTGAYWNYYTLSIPPIGALNETLHPNVASLGEYNTKYIISPYEVNDLDLKYVTKIGNFLIYLNEIYQPRSPAPITKYLPNVIKIDTSNYKNNSLVVSEVYNKDWKAYLDNNKEVKIQEAPNRLRHIDLTPGTNEVTLKYEPEIFKVGKIITLISLISIVIIGYANIKMKR